MNEDRLKTLLRETPVPGETEAAQRGLRVVNEAFAEHKPPRPAVLPRLAVAFALVTLLAALMLSPAGAKVRGWIDDVFTAGVRNAEPALTQLPGGGRLLVHSADGAWVVHGDGSRRLLGRFAEATWSPRGLFVAVTSGRTLSAVDPEGNPRWSISAGAPVSDPRWSPSGVRIAYRAGRQLRVIVANGSGDAVLDPLVAPLAPAWSPQGAHLLAYVDSGGKLRLVNTDTRQTLGSFERAAGHRGAGLVPERIGATGSVAEVPTASRGDDEQAGRPAGPRPPATHRPPRRRNRARRRLRPRRAGGRGAASPSRHRPTLDPQRSSLDRRPQWNAAPPLRCLRRPLRPRLVSAGTSPAPHLASRRPMAVHPDTWPRHPSDRPDLRRVRPWRTKPVVPAYRGLVLPALAGFDLQPCSGASRNCCAGVKKLR